MQSSLLALLLAGKFFPEPLVRLPCGISVIVMTLVRSWLALFCPCATHHACDCSLLPMCHSLWVRMPKGQKMIWSAELDVESKPGTCMPM